MKQFELKCKGIQTLLSLEKMCGGAGGTGEQDAWGGAFGVTKGLLSEFGSDRIMDTPITESAFVGAAVGAAMTGLGHYEYVR